MSTYRVDLIIQVRTGTPARFRADVPAAGHWEAWAAALAKLRKHAVRRGWDPEDYRVLSHGTFREITPGSEE